MNAIIFHPFFIASLLAILCAFAGRQILHLFRIEIGGLNIYLKISLSMAVAELGAIFLLNILFNYISYRPAGWLCLALLLILAAVQLAAKFSHPPLIKSWSTEILPIGALALMAFPAFFGLLHSTINHIEVKYLFVSFIRNVGLPIMERLPDNSWTIHNYHYGAELIVAVLSSLTPLYDCIGFVNLTKIPGALHIVIYLLMLYGVTSQLIPAVAWMWRCAIVFFVLYYGGNTLLIYFAYGGPPLAAFFNESLVPNSYLIAGWANPLIRSVLSDSLIVAFRSWEMSIQHLMVVFLPVLWVLVVNNVAGNNNSGDRRERVILSSALLISMLATGFLIHEEVVIYVLCAGLFYLFYKIRRTDRRTGLFACGVLVIAFTGLFALLQGGTISHLFYSHLSGGKVELVSAGEGDLASTNVIRNPSDRHITIRSNPALIGYGLGRISLIKDPWKVLVHHGIDYYILIPVVTFYLLRRMKRMPEDFSGVLDFWIMMAVPMAFFSLFLRIAGQDFLCERFNKIELAALIILILFFWVREKARSAWGNAHGLKYGIFYLAVALFFVFSTTRSIFYYATTPRAENIPLQEYCAERVNRFVNDSR